MRGLFDPPDPPDDYSADMAEHMRDEYDRNPDLCANCCAGLAFDDPHVQCEGCGGVICKPCQVTRNKAIYCKGCAGLFRHQQRGAA